MDRNKAWQGSAIRRGSQTDSRRDSTSVLIVEDEPLIGRDLADSLAALNYRVVGVADSADQAVALAREHAPDVALMDIRLKGPKDGIEAANELQALRQMPIVYLSANADAKTLDRALQTAPGGFLAKPFNVRTLKATIEIAMQRHATEQSLQQLARRNEDRVELYRAEAVVDALTGLFNRRHLDSVLKSETNRARRDGSSLAIMMIDLDGFKDINDRFGHTSGDAVLKAVAKAMRTQLRNYDTPCRYGGDEIVAVLPGASRDDALRSAERLRAAVAALRIESDDGRDMIFTVSIGVSSISGVNCAADALLAAADKALYEAKRAGRNRVVAAEVE